MGLISGALGAVTGLFGTFGRNKMLNEQIKSLERDKADNQSWYDRRYNEDATQRADAQRMLQMTEDNIRNRNRQAAGAAAVMGGTDESLAAARAANANAMADTAAQIAVAGANRKDAIESQYMAKKDAYNEEIRKANAQKANGWDMANAALNGASKGLGVGLDMSEQKGWKNWI